MGVDPARFLKLPDPDAPAGTSNVEGAIDRMTGQLVEAGHHHERARQIAVDAAKRHERNK